MADHLPAFLLNYSGAWSDVTGDVSQGDGLKIGMGGGEVSAAPKASSVELTFEDPDGVYRPYLASSPLYGLAGRNTPLLVGYDVLTETFETTPLGITVGAGAGINPWARSSTSPHSGSWCFKSGATADGGVSDAVITAPAGATVCVLWYRTDCQATDRLQIYVGDDIRVNVGGTGGAWTQVTLPIIPVGGVPSGARVVYVRYLKDASGTGGADAVYIDDVRFLCSRGVTEVSSWRPDRTLGYQQSPPRGRQWTDVTSGGLLRRLGSWTEVVQSAYTRQVLATSGLTDFWPLEEPRGSSVLSSIVSAAPNQSSFGAPGVALNTGNSLGDTESPGGGSTSMRFESNGNITGTFTPITAAGYTVSFAFKLADLSLLTGSDTLFFSWADTAQYSFFVEVSNSTYSLLITGTHGETIVYDSTLYGAGASPDQWIQMSVTISVSGGTVSYSRQWRAEGTGATTYLTSGSYSGPASRPTFWSLFSYNELVGGWLGYVFLTTDTTVNVLGSDFTDAFAGRPGETAGARFQRLMTEAGLRATLLGRAADTEPMGPQRPDVLFKLLQEIRDTDGGVLVDSLNEIGATYRTRQNLYSLTPLALTYELNVAPPMSPVLDDLGTHNSITVTDRAGASVTAEDTTSAMGTAAPPAGVGEYKQQIDVNVLNASRLLDLAYWWLNIGTLPDARYQSVTVDLDANPSLATSARMVAPGDRLTISALDPDLVDLLVVAVSDVQKTQKRNTITFLCTPYRQYDVALYVAAGATPTAVMKRYESRTSTLNAGYNATVTTIVVTFTDLGDAWSTTAVPYDWAVAGERITVTAMGAVTGSGPWTQTATVTRSVNGIVKTHLAGEPVHMHPDQQARYAL